MTQRGTRWIRGGTARRTPVRYLVPLLLLAAPAAGQRQTVLQQIALPHNYYYREMYLPQATSGPSSVAWTADGKALIYSM